MSLEAFGYIILLMHSTKVQQVEHFLLHGNPLNNLFLMM